MTLGSGKLSHNLKDKFFGKQYGSLDKVMTNTLAYFFGARVAKRKKGFDNIFTQNSALTQKAKFWCNYVGALKGKSLKQNIQMVLVHFVNLPLCQIGISSTCHFIKHFVNLPYHQPVILSTCHFVNLPFCQLAILSTCHFVNLPFHQLVISSTA